MEVQNMTGEQTELRFLTPAEAAIILQVSKRTILRMIQKKEVPALKVGGQWRLRESQLKRWAEEKETDLSAFEQTLRREHHGSFRPHCRGLEGFRSRVRRKASRWCRRRQGAAAARVVARFEH